MGGPIINNSKNVWLIPDMYWPEITSDGHYVSHESICVLNTNDIDCNLNIVLYYEDSEPRSFKYVCPALRTRHIRMDKVILDNGTAVPRGIPYSAKIECDMPVAIQYTRVDTTQAENSIMTTVACKIS